MNLEIHKITYIFCVIQTQRSPDPDLIVVCISIKVMQYVTVISFSIISPTLVRKK